MAGANRDRRAHRMSERKYRRRAIGQNHLLHDGFEIGDVIRKISHIALVTIGERVVRQSLSAPVESRHRKATGTKIANGLEIFLDKLGATLQHNHGAFAPRWRRPTRKAQVHPVRGFDRAGHHVVWHRIGGDGNEFHEAGDERCAPSAYSRVASVLNAAAACNEKSFSSNCF
jgi:hypothetical protein